LLLFEKKPQQSERKHFKELLPFAVPTTTKFPQEEIQADLEGKKKKNEKMGNNKKKRKKKVLLQ
jgi:hypothetical protein